MRLASGIQLLHERVLMDRVRRGDVEAFDELYRRNAHAVWRLSLAVSLAPQPAAAALITSFATAWTHGPVTNLERPARARLLTAARHTSIDHPDAVMPGLTEVPLPPAPGLVQAPFAGLPEPHRTVLWLRDAERVPAAEVAQVMELAVDDVDRLAGRATAGFVQQIIAARSAGLVDRDCRRVTDRLGAYAAAHLPPRDTTRIRRHLEACERCRGFFAGLDDLTPALRGLSIPLPASLAAAARFRWQSALVPVEGPLHLVLPGGRPVPPWAERAMAGAAAAVVALGIVGATLLVGRGNRSGDDVRSGQTTDQPYGADDGESALAIPGFDDLQLPGGTPIAAPSQGGAAAPADEGATDAPEGLPRSGGSGGGSAPLPTTPPGGTPPPPGGGGSTTTTTAPPPTTTAPPALQVDGGIDGVLEVAVGDECTGVAIAGTVIGCEPTTGTGLETGGSLLP